MPGIRLEINLPRLTEEEFDDVVSEAFGFVQDITPVDEGYCVSQWEDNSSFPVLLFENDCEYASYLDDGWSKQAPSGMTRPTISFIRQTVQGYE